PVPGTMVGLSQPFNPPVFKGITVYPENPFKFDFILDKGNPVTTNDTLEDTSRRLVKYFLSSVTTPEKDLWVNLSPYEHNRIIPESFGQTDMGRDLLAQDYILKQITSSLMYPEGETGKKFWAKVYQSAYEKYGTTDIPFDTFNKVWIVPEYAKVYEHGNTAFVIKARMKVMLESDYLALENNVTVNASSSVGDDLVSARRLNDNISETQELSEKAIREVVIPILENEVNEGKTFAPLRQVYYSLILAVWFKKRMKDTLLGRKYMDQNKVTGIDIEDKNAKEAIYQQYLTAFKQGVYNYVKEETDPLTQETLPRKYFSGGVEMGAVGRNTDFTETLDSNDKSMVTLLGMGNTLVKLIANLIDKKPPADVDEFRYQTQIHHKFLSILKYGLIGPAAAKKLNTDLFTSNDIAGGDKELHLPMAMTQELLSPDDHKKLNVDVLAVPYEEGYLKKVVDDLVNLHDNGNNPVTILGERTASTLLGQIRDYSDLEMEEFLRTGILILMKKELGDKELASVGTPTPGAIEATEFAPDMIEAVFVPTGMFDSLKAVVPRQFKRKMVRVENEKEFKIAQDHEVKIPDWEAAILKYLTKNNRSRTLFLHGARFPTKAEALVSAPVESRLEEVKPGNPDYRSHFEMLLANAPDGARATAELLTRNSKASYVFKAEIEGATKDVHVIWNYESNDLLFKGKIDEESWSAWSGAEPMVKEASKILAEVLGEVRKFYPWGMFPAGIVIDKEGNFQADNDVGLHVGFSQAKMLLGAIKRKNSRHIETIRKELATRMVHHLAHRERAETGELDSAYADSLPTVVQEIGSHVVEFLFDPYHRYAQYFFKIALDNFFAGESGQELTIAADAYYGSKYRALLIVAHELAKHDANYREIYLQDTSKYKLEAIKRIVVNNQDVLTPDVYKYLSKDFIHQVMPLSQEELLALSNRIMADPGIEIDLTRETNAQNGGIDLTANRMDAAEAIDLRAVQPEKFTKTDVLNISKSPKMIMCQGRSNADIYDPDSPNLYTRNTEEARSLSRQTMLMSGIDALRETEYWEQNLKKRSINYPSVVDVFELDNFNLISFPDMRMSKELIKEWQDFLKKWAVQHEKRWEENYPARKMVSSLAKRIRWALNLSTREPHDVFAWDDYWIIGLEDVFRDFLTSKQIDGVVSWRTKKSGGDHPLVVFVANRDKLKLLETVPASEFRTISKRPLATLDMTHPDTLKRILRVFKKLAKWPRSQSLTKSPYIKSANTAGSDFGKRVDEMYRPFAIKTVERIKSIFSGLIKEFPREFYFDDNGGYEFGGVNTARYKYFSQGHDFGVKFHLNVKKEYLWNVAKYLMENNYHHKMFSGGEVQDGKVFTIYVGDFDLALELGKKLGADLKEFLYYPAEEEEIEFGVGVVGRFAVNENVMVDMEFQKYGGLGITYLSKKETEVMNWGEDPVGNKWINSFVRLYSRYGSFFFNSHRLSEIEKDANPAMNPGGIDLTANRMNVDVATDKAALAQPMGLKALENIEINGLYIKGIEIHPLNNLSEVLGINH
ncbi:MAG: hypothetical protein HQL22_12310, partial [Candidatus Omnitrophica bacterium]|nr:hypothetical protein [Candidatus Omnitrophota bacterium]